MSMALFIAIAFYSLIANPPFVAKHTHRNDLQYLAWLTYTIVNRFKIYDLCIVFIIVQHVQVNVVKLNLFQRCVGWMPEDVLMNASNRIEWHSNENDKTNQKVPFLMRKKFLRDEKINHFEIKVCQSSKTESALFYKLNKLNVLLYVPIQTYLTFPIIIFYHKI